MSIDSGLSFAVAAAEKQKCDGACESHHGDVRVVRVEHWGYFAYCDEAIAEDRRRGLAVAEYPTTQPPRTP